MKTLTELLKKLNELNQQKEQLKLWLVQKEVVEYYNWKAQNEKDRTAMDKVVAQLKLDDETWLEKEDEYSKIKVEYENLKRVYDIVQNLISREYTIEIIEEFINEFI